MDSNEYTGSVSTLGQNYVSPNYLECDGKTYPISQYEQMYSLLGTAFGGDGRSTVGVPDLRGRVAIGAGQGPGLTARTLGQMGGSPTVTLKPQLANLPPHTHQTTFDRTGLNGLVATISDVTNTTVDGTLACNRTTGGVASPVGAYPGTSSSQPWSPTPNSSMAVDVIALGIVDDIPATTQFSSNTIPVTFNSNGESTPLETPTAMPAQAFHQVICAQGLFPPRG
ncbi:MAG: tail fiber protein [bacterium]|nr:tail fiber protein [bacterium]